VTTSPTFAALQRASAFSVNVFIAILRIFSSYATPAAQPLDGNYGASPGLQDKCSQHLKLRNRAFPNDQNGSDPKLKSLNGRPASEPYILFFMVSENFIKSSSSCRCPFEL